MSCFKEVVSNYSDRYIYLPGHGQEFSLVTDTIDMSGRTGANGAGERIRHRRGSRERDDVVLAEWLRPDVARRPYPDHRLQTAELLFRLWQQGGIVSDCPRSLLRDVPGRRRGSAE